MYHAREVRISKSRRVSETCLLLLIPKPYARSLIYRVVRRPYALTDKGMKTTRMPTHQAIAIQIVEASGWLRISPRVALTICVTGWCSAKVRSQGGILCVGTNALLANVKGKSQMKPSDCAASTLFTDNPIVAEIQENAKLVNKRIPTAANKKRKLPCG